MKLELIGHDEKYALEQSLLTLFPGEKPVYGTVDKTADTRWARVTLTEEDERVQVTTVRTLGSPLTVITQLVQRPIPQKYPLGS